MENNVMTIEQPAIGFKKIVAKVTNKVKGFFAAANALAMSVMATVTCASALGSTDVKISTTDVNADELMGKIIGILLTITRFVGVALVIYGVYEIVMSFMQNQPEAKTKGIVMALAGVVMIALKSVLKGLNVIGG